MKSSFMPLAALLLALIGPVQADTIFDNSSPVTNSADSISLYGPLYGSFSTNASGGSLTALELSILLGEYAQTGGIDIGLYSDSSTSPGTEIATIGFIDDTTLDLGPLNTGELYNISLTSQPVLAANTRYWIGLSNDSSTDPTPSGWTYTTDLSGPGVATEYYDNTSQGITPNSSFGGYQMLVQTTAPEPATLSAFLLGLCLLAFRLRHRLSSAS